jgi:hypothetical protein
LILLAPVVALSLAGCGKGSTIHASGVPVSAALDPVSKEQRGLDRCPQRMRLEAGPAVAVGSGAGALAVEGNTVWVAREQAGTVTRVTGSRLDVLHVGPTPVSLSLGFGKLWVALRDADRVVFVDMHTLKQEQGASVAVPVDLFAGLGSVWVLSLDSGALYRLDPISGVLGEPIYAPVGDPIDMAASGGELWVLGAHEGGLSPLNARLGRIVRAGFDLPSRRLSGLSASDSTIWLGEPAQGRLLRIDASTVAVSELRAPSGVSPDVTDVGRCGVWVASHSGTLDLIDPRTGTALAAPTRIGRSVAALAVSGAGVWASDPIDGTIAYVSARPSG